MYQRLVKYQLKPLQTLKGSRPCQVLADIYIDSVCVKYQLKPKETQNVSRACQLSASTHSNARNLYPYSIHFSFLRRKIKYTTRWLGLYSVSQQSVGITHADKALHITLHPQGTLCGEMFFSLTVLECLDQM